MATAHDVAAAVVNRLGPMTSMKLEKLVYYCQGWHLARSGDRLFDEAVEAWREGPVVPALFRRHRRQYTVTAWPDGDPAHLDEKQAETIDWVIGEYGSFSALQLSQMTHSELPWRMARNGLPDAAPSSEPISTDIMRAYYGRQIADPETAVATATANAALEGIEFDDIWQDRMRDVATGLVAADDVVAEEIARIRGA